MAIPVARPWAPGGAPVAVAILVATLLNGCRDQGVRPTQSVTAADTADQVLVTMEHVITSDGVRRTRVVADTAWIYEGTSLARLRIMTVTFFDTYGNETSTVTADSGLYQMRDGSMNAWGNVVGRTPDGRTLRSPELRYNAHLKQISSERSFVYDRPGEHLVGDAFHSDPDFRNVTAVRPRGSQQGGAARPDSGRGGGFLLPGQ